MVRLSRWTPGVRECMDLLHSGFAFRGFTLKDEVGGVSLPVARAGVRNVLPSCLLALTDHAVSPADVVLIGAIGPGSAVLTVSVRPGQGSPGFESDALYRLLEWHEVEALARADGIALDRKGRTDSYHHPGRLKKNGPGHRSSAGRTSKGDLLRCAATLQRPLRL